MTAKRLGIHGLALGHPIGFAKHLVEGYGMEVSFLAYDESQEEERSRKDTLMKTYPSLSIVRDANEMIERGVDAVFCASQAHRHYELCAPYVESRIPLFIDKPFANNYEQAKKILDLTKQHDAPMMSCSVRRYAEGYNHIFSAIGDGRAGVPLFAECFEPHPCPPGYWQDRIESSGGFVVNYGVHVVDPIVKALGTDIESVYATASKNSVPDMYSEDTGIIHIKYRNGPTAIGKVSGGYEEDLGHVRPSQGHFILHASKGILQSFIMESDVTYYNSAVFRGAPGVYHRRSGTAGTLDAFATMVEAKQRPIPLTDMDAVMRILDAARRSIGTKSVVTL
jgi:predicted dehydrogenase